MREEIANLVFPVFNYGIRLKEMLASNDLPDLRTAQKTLLGMLQTASSQRDFVGDPGFGHGSEVSAGRPDQFLGIRYALVCWLDEIFIDSPWKTEWNENKLEQAMFGTNDRAWKFWDPQAKLAGNRPDTDALEAFYLCVMLGFRGDLEGLPDKLKAWREATESQLKKGEHREFPLPAEGRPLTNVPPLTGERRKQKMALIFGVALLLLIPAAVFLLFRFLGS